MEKWDLMSYVQRQEGNGVQAGVSNRQWLAVDWLHTVMLWLQFNNAMAEKHFHPFNAGFWMKLRLL